jgi:hypothetical protein
VFTVSTEVARGSGVADAVVVDVGNGIWEVEFSEIGGGVPPPEMSDVVLVGTPEGLVQSLFSSKSPAETPAMVNPDLAMPCQ